MTTITTSMLTAVSLAASLIERFKASTARPAPDNVVWLGTINGLDFYQLPSGDVWTRGANWSWYALARDWHHSEAALVFAAAATLRDADGRLSLPESVRLVQTLTLRQREQLGHKAVLS